jgi:hypothetical protein
MPAFSGVALGKLGPWLVFAVLICMLAATTASNAEATDPTCLTKAEARQKFPKVHLYWHTQHRCWDATPPSRANRAQYRRGSTVGKAVEAPGTRYQPVIPPAPVPAKRSFIPWEERIESTSVRARRDEDD